MFLSGPPTRDPASASAVAVVVNTAPGNPQYRTVTVTGTEVLPPKRFRPSEQGEYERHVKLAKRCVPAPAPGVAKQIPWPSSAFSLPWPHSAAVMRLVYNAASAAPAAREAAITKAATVYHSPATATPERSEVLRCLIGSSACADDGDGYLRFSLPQMTPLFCHIISMALQYNAVLTLPRSVRVPLSDEVYKKCVLFMLRLAARRIAEHAASVGGPGWPSRFTSATLPSGPSSAAAELAAKAGMVIPPSAAKSRHAHYNRQLTNGKPYVRGVKACYSVARRGGVGCIGCPLSDGDKAAVCGAQVGDTPVTVWTRMAGTSPSLESVAATVPPCYRRFGAEPARQKDAWRFDAGNVAKIMASLCHA